jgi:CheY-like chemotaxis protein
VNGIDLIKQLRETPITASIPILAVTAYGQSAARNAEAAGASFCFRKPLAFNELLPQVRSLLA